MARWVVKNVPFDRLYFYGDARPVHVSYGLESKREIVIMRKNREGRLIPKVMKEAEFMALSAAELAIAACL